MVYRGDPQEADIYGNTLNNLNETSSTPSAAQTESFEYALAPFNPYPDYNSKGWNAKNAGVYHRCHGAGGITYVDDDDHNVYYGRLQSFNESGSGMGSFKELGINDNICYERSTRLGPYGYNDRDPEAESTAYDNVDWHELQEKCAADNIDRYMEPTTATKGAPKKERTALVVRTWAGRKYTENDKQTFRSLINELSLRSGGEYQVFFLVHLNKEESPVWEDKEVYEQAMVAGVPPEFANMTVFWSQAKMKELYPNIDDEAQSVHRSQWLPLQKFAQSFPQFEYFWNWEMDVRHTGHHYETLERISAFALKQPRKGLWERNERYYIPSIHGPHSTTFRKAVEKASGPNTVWGPPTVENLIPAGPKPPVANPAQDKYKWGVGEEGDYITLTPIFNPNDTNWILRNEVWGYQGVNYIPRRISIGTLARVSRRLLDAMHTDNLDGNTFTSEMNPPSAAFLHGFKAVYAPIRVMFDRPWPTTSLNRYFNPGPKGVSGSSQDSPFGWGLENRFQGSTWYFRATPGERMYNNWMGWEDSGIGGLQVSFPFLLQGGKIC
jgi:hypothetical protein